MLQASPFSICWETTLIILDLDVDLFLDNVDSDIPVHSIFIARQNVAITSFHTEVILSSRIEFEVSLLLMA